MVFDVSVSDIFAQWTRYSDKHKRSEKKKTKHNKSRRKKPIISGPFPADPDRLQGEKWQYVILTRLDTEPPPERPPRTKRCRRQETAISGVSGIVRWGSERRRRRRRSFGRRRQTTPPQSLSADEPTEPVSSGRIEVGDDGGTVKRAVAAAEKKAPPAFDKAVEKTSMWVVLWSGAVVAGRTFAARQNGLLKSVARAHAMANDLTS
ncbi:uncharacterized protein LOC100574342 isoform X2 [Acyrthosiphon pisum]|uniref:Uncharacterized protein n=1 Tax=Acyrthosiphon pisum TaxID=7029 RepID=A0A8R2D4T4_ACYPI|nr:uncharacterized protein LOC100574342 isoform X2 [Acyrthosiphon pisum]|eukprot:XP_016661385.1 PREDICTED: uncharacterized protein LOC100574342 isoform X2 [Acyrthosiphon pisum]